jgi:hypothetical protein
MELANNKINERYILRVEHLVHDFANWKKVFDSDPGHRQKSGVIRYRISHLVDNPNYVMIDLEFESLISLEKFHNVLRKLWTNADGKIIEGGPESRSAKLVECKDL